MWEIYWIDLSHLNVVTLQIVVFDKLDYCATLNNLTSIKNNLNFKVSTLSSSKFGVVLGFLHQQIWEFIPEISLLSYPCIYLYVYNQISAFNSITNMPLSQLTLSAVH